MRSTTPLAILLSVLALALAGCGDDDDGDEGAPATTAATTTTATTTESATTSEEEPELRVGLITDLGQLDDDGFNELAFRGLQRAEKELGVEGRVIESASAADYIPNMTSLARQGYDLVIGVGFAQGDAIGKAADRFPETKFAIIDVDHAFVPGEPPNVQGLLFREEEAGYLVGYLAALQEQRRQGPDMISAVGGFKEPPVDRFIAGYEAGAEKAVPGIDVFWSYSNDWDDQAKCKELALNQIQRGSGVVFQVAGGCGLGALNAAGERDRWGIGVDADQAHLGDHILTSALKRVDAAVHLTIESVIDGTWRGGGNSTFGLAEEGVGIGKVSALVEQVDLDRLEEIREQIRSGEIRDIPTRVGRS